MLVGQTLRPMHQLWEKMGFLRIIREDFVLVSGMKVRFKALALAGLLIDALPVERTFLVGTLSKWEGDWTISPMDRVKLSKVVCSKGAFSTLASMLRMCLGRSGDPLVNPLARWRAFTGQNSLVHIGPEGVVGLAFGRVEKLEPIKIVPST